MGSVTSLRTLGDKMSRTDRADLLVTIEEEANRLTRFVSDLLDMTRIEAGAIDVRKDSIDVGEVIRTVAHRAGKLFGSRNLKVTIDGNLPLVRADAALLDQVVFNLLENANKYSGPQSITRVGAAADGGDIRLSVTDDGIGIPKEALEKVFEKFYRVGGNDGRPSGTGLGLSICAGLVKAMGGTIKAESPIDHGRGTRMTIKLPAALPQRAPQTTAER